MVSLAPRGVQVSVPSSIPAQCEAPCANYQSVVSECASPTPQCLCTLEVEHASYACALCTATKRTFAAAQASFDQYVAQCNARGFALPPLVFPGQTTNVTAVARVSTSTTASVPPQTLTVSAIAHPTTRSTTGTSSAPTPTQLVFHSGASRSRPCARARLLAVLVLGVVASCL